MHNLLSLFLKYRASVLFIVLEGISTAFIVNTNTYHQAAIINSSNYAVATAMETSNTLSTYFQLQEVNDQLAEENARLRGVVASEGSPRSTVGNPPSGRLFGTTGDGVRLGGRVTDGH